MFYDSTENKRKMTCAPSHQNRPVDECINSEIIGKCVTCNDDITEQYVGYECSFCNDKYHKQCINPSSYCDNISLDISVLFICIACESNINIDK